jgi:hypothetical protein
MIHLLKVPLLSGLYRYFQKTVTGNSHLNREERNGWERYNRDKNALPASDSSDFRGAVWTNQPVKGSTVENQIIQ